MQNIIKIKKGVHIMKGKNYTSFEEFEKDAFPKAYHEEQELKKLERPTRSKKFDSIYYREGIQEW